MLNAVGRCFVRDVFSIFVFVLLIVGFLNISISAGGEGSLPDLIPVYLDCPDAQVDDEGFWVFTEGKEVEVVFKVENVGDKNVTTNENIEVGLFVDHGSTPVAVNSSNQGLPVGGFCYVNVSWVPTTGFEGKHVLSMVVNYRFNQGIKESNYFNNTWDFSVVFSERGTDLEIIDIDVPSSVVVNETVNVFASVRNNGRSTNESIYVRLNSSAQGEIETVVKKDGLYRDEVYVFSFNWTPSGFGSQILTVEVFLGNVSYDVEKVSVVVGVEQLKWWDENWHYRYFLSVNGSGNVSKFFNFTELLTELGVNSTFENDTVRVVCYSNNGSIFGVVDKYRFDESEGFNPMYNATGVVLWNVSDNSGSGEKYYCVYFDVNANPGTRTAGVEDGDINVSGNVTIGSMGFVDGWHASITEPLEGSYTLRGDSINISVSTSAKVENVTAFLYLKDNISHNFTVTLFDTGDMVNWLYTGFNSFDMDGNWSVNVTCRDGAGYQCVPVQHDILVGRPDLEIVNLSISSLSGSEKVYVNDTVNVNVSMVSHNAGVENVSILLSIADENNREVFNETRVVSLKKEVDTTVGFNWFANKSGEFNIVARLDPMDMVDESKEDNNNMSTQMIVYEWPDLAVKNIILPMGDIMEFDRVKIDVTVENQGLSDASNYMVKLYIESVPKNGPRIMKYTGEKDTKLVSVKSNSTQRVSMYWNNSKAGIWMVGVKIIVLEGQRDSNLWNNQNVSSEDLIVKSYEKNPPVISLFTIQPDVPEEGDVVTITAKIVDDTGLKTVTINITNPDGISIEESMIKTSNDIFKYIYTDGVRQGLYSFVIKAVDISFYQNNKTFIGNFTVKKDTTVPVVSFFTATPYVQVVGGYVNISCFASDNVGISSVRVKIISPTGSVSEETMTYETNNKYVYKNIYSVSGVYTYYIIVRDKVWNEVKTEEKKFWITRNIDDMDDDGIPDWWEERYGLDPMDPSDADSDLDGDGLSNLMEYRGGSNPLRDVFFENMGVRLKNNSLYVVMSIVLFLIVLLLSYIGRRMRW
ncbi:MAG: hypothetical protein DRM98_01250 [Thermoplasmata archaeon]|nr:MAG: hypothetical protein DRM98_01250 [Thermoplasmata archaeon]